MILVLAHHVDAEAEWLRRELEQRAAGAVLLLCPEALGVDYSVTLRLRNDGRHTSEIVPAAPAGRRIGSDAVRLVINRLSFIDPLVWQRADPGEAAYASSELNAFFPAFIHAFDCPVSNPARHGALWVGAGFGCAWALGLEALGVPLHPCATATAEAVWTCLAGAEPASLRRWMVFDGRIFTPPDQPPVAGPHAGALLELGADECLELIALQSDDSTTPPRLLQVSRTPALSTYGAAFVDAVLRHLEGPRDDRLPRHPERATAAPAG